MRTKKLKIREAVSTSEGIQFYSRKQKGYLALATIDEIGIITTEWTTVNRLPKGKQEKFAFLKSILITVMYMLTKELLKLSSTMSLRFLLIFLIAFTAWRFMLAIKKSDKTSFKFHSAEHMGINAFNKLGRVPTIDEIKQYSRFNNNCGTNTAADFSVLCTLMLLCTFIPNIYLEIIGILVSVLIVVILKNIGCLNFLQKFTTLPPTDKELFVAIAGIEEWIANEKRNN